MSQTTPRPSPCVTRRRRPSGRHVDLGRAAPGAQAGADSRPARNVPQRGHGLEARDGERGAVRAEVERQDAGAAMVELAEELAGARRPRRAPSRPPRPSRAVVPSGLKATAKLPYCRAGRRVRCATATAPDRSQNSTSPWSSPTSDQAERPVGAEGHAAGGEAARRRHRARRRSPRPRACTPPVPAVARIAAVRADARHRQRRPWWPPGTAPGRAPATRRPRASRSPLRLTAASSPAVRGERQGLDLPAGIRAAAGRAGSGRSASRSATPRSFRPTAISFPSGLYLPGMPVVRRVEGAVVRERERLREAAVPVRSQAIAVPSPLTV